MHSQQLTPCSASSQDAGSDRLSSLSSSSNASAQTRGCGVAACSSGRGPLAVSAFFADGTVLNGDEAKSAIVRQMFGDDCASQLMAKYQKRSQRRSQDMETDASSSSDGLCSAADVSAADQLQLMVQDVSISSQCSTNGECSLDKKSEVIDASMQELMDASLSCFNQQMQEFLSDMLEVNEERVRQRHISSRSYALILFDKILHQHQLSPSQQRTARKQLLSNMDRCTDMLIRDRRQQQLLMQDKQQTVVLRPQSGEHVGQAMDTDPEQNDLKEEDDQMKILVQDLVDHHRRLMLSTVACEKHKSSPSLSAVIHAHKQVLQECEWQYLQHPLIKEHGKQLDHVEQEWRDKIADDFQKMKSEFKQQLRLLIRSLIDDCLSWYIESFKSKDDFREDWRSSWSLLHKQVKYDSLSRLLSHALLKSCTDDARKKLEMELASLIDSHFAKNQRKRRFQQQQQQQQQPPPNKRPSSESAEETEKDSLEERAAGNKDASVNVMTAGSPVEEAMQTFIENFTERITMFLIECPDASPICLLSQRDSLIDRTLDEMRQSGMSQLAMDLARFRMFASWRQLMYPDGDQRQASSP